jgi:hypothetical protein
MPALPPVGYLLYYYLKWQLLLVDAIVSRLTRGLRRLRPTKRVGKARFRRPLLSTPRGLPKAPKWRYLHLYLCNTHLQHSYSCEPPSPHLHQQSVDLRQLTWTRTRSHCPKKNDCYEQIRGVLFDPCHFRRKGGLRSPRYGELEGKRYFTVYQETQLRDFLILVRAYLCIFALLSFGRTWLFGS